MSAIFSRGQLIHVPAQTGRVRGSLGGCTVGMFRLPTDPLKYVVLTFDGVNAGSEIRCYLNSTGDELFGVESCDANHVFSGVPYFGTGQVTTVHIVNMGYRLKEFAYTVPGSDQVIPIQQEVDRWYKNP